MALAHSELTAQGQVSVPAAVSSALAFSLKRFLAMQLNKVNSRKEFFRVGM